MHITVFPTEKIDQLKQNLQKRVESVEEKDDHLEVEDADVETVDRTPGIESYRVEGEEHQGLQGSPVDEQVYARVEDRSDVVKALLATIQGYNLVILNTEKEWDIRQLKRYNPDIKHLRQDEPAELFEIDRAISDVEGTEKIEIEMPDEEEQELIYREMLV
jgi:hypothetical protein